jgi:hyaluronan synthase
MESKMSTTKKAGTTAPRKTASQDNTLYSMVIPVPGRAMQRNVTDAYHYMEPSFRRLAKTIKFTWKKYLPQITIGATFMLLITAAVLMFVLHGDYEKFNLERLATTPGKIFVGITLLIALYKLCFFFYKIYLYLTYKPIESVSDEALPKVTVIVPAYNEGKLVYHTLMSIAESYYPHEKLEILSIDDGSKDDTWYWMQQAKLKLGDRVSICQQPKNMGKRHALYRGFNTGKGDVFVTIDSDSIIMEDTLRNLVSPFVTNPECGAVAGNVQVLNNEQKALIPKMLNVSFVFSFEFVRSAESRLGSVLCTPGALSAYRRESVFACLEDWMNQTFMGQPSDIGEDRAMTNMILKQGKHVLFQSNALVLTNVPEKFKGLYKMFIRWGRSNVRENIAMTSFVFKKFRNESRVGTRLLYISQWLRMIIAYPAVLFMLYFFITHPLLFFATTLFGILVFSTVSVFFYSRRYSFPQAVWAYCYGIMFAFGLFWIAPYSIATAGKSGWLTRA